jgi:hypothetical protein
LAVVVDLVAVTKQVLLAIFRGCY